MTLEQDLGTGRLLPFAGQHVDVTLTDTNGATHSAPTGTCTTAGPNTDAAGHCTITFTSLTTGTVTGHATATVSVAGSTPFTVQTNGVPPNSGDATKVFQDANIQITPNGTNPVGADHTFTAHVNVEPGDGTGFVNAPDGTSITFTTVDATAPPRRRPADPVHHRRVAPGQLHDDHHLADDRHPTVQRAHDVPTSAASR